LRGLSQKVNLGVLRNKVNILGDFEIETPTQISRSNSQGFGPKIRYPQNQNDSLNQIQLFELKKSISEKSCVNF